METGYFPWAYHTPAMKATGKAQWGLVAPHSTGSHAQQHSQQGTGLASQSQHPRRERGRFSQEPRSSGKSRMTTEVWGHPRKWAHTSGSGLVTAPRLRHSPVTARPSGPGQGQASSQGSGSSSAGPTARQGTAAAELETSTPNSTARTPEEGWA